MADKPKKMTMQNTKKEMLDAYQEVVQQLKEKQAAALKPEAEIAERRTQEAVEVTDTLSTEGIAQEVSSLRLEIGRLLSQLSDKLEEEVSRYRQVRVAVQARERELQEIYEIEKSAQTLAALIEAQHQKRAQMESDLESRREDLTREIETLRAEWKREKDAHAAEIAARDAEEKKRRSREKEEHDYAFQREQQLAREQFEDERARLEREISNRREQMEKELSEREKAIAGREQELSSLRARVEAFPAELESAVSSAVKDATRHAESVAKSREELLRREFDGERNVLNTRIESLEKTVAEQNQQIARLSQQVEKAYGQVQDIATQAIGSSRPAPGWQPVISEPARKPTQEA
jgi:DNA repair exonuclease SbcCD ATPase subunit